MSNRDDGLNLRVVPGEEAQFGVRGNDSVFENGVEGLEASLDRVIGAEPLTEIGGR